MPRVWHSGKMNLFKERTTLVSPSGSNVTVFSNTTPLSASPSKQTESVMACIESEVWFQGENLGSSWYLISRSASEEHFHRSLRYRSTLMASAELPLPASRESLNQAEILPVEPFPTRSVNPLLFTDPHFLWINILMILVGVACSQAFYTSSLWLLTVCKNGRRISGESYYMICGTDGTCHRASSQQPDHVRDWAWDSVLPTRMGQAPAKS